MFLNPARMMKTLFVLHIYAFNIAVVLPPSLSDDISAAVGLCCPDKPNPPLWTQPLHRSAFDHQALLHNGILCRHSARFVRAQKCHLVLNCPLIVSVLLSI